MCLNESIRCLSKKLAYTVETVSRLRTRTLHLALKSFMQIGYPRVRLSRITLSRTSCTQSTLKLSQGSNFFASICEGPFPWCPTTGAPIRVAVTRALNSHIPRWVSQAMCSSWGYTKTVRPWQLCQVISLKAVFLLAIRKMYRRKAPNQSLTDQDLSLRVRIGQATSMFMTLERLPDLKNNKILKTHDTTVK